jgi:hypothetical protein
MSAAARSTTTIVNVASSNAPAVVATVSTSTKLPTRRRKFVVDSDSDVDSNPAAISTIIAFNKVASSGAPTVETVDVSSSSDGLQDDEIWVRPSKTQLATATATPTSGNGVPPSD